MSFDTSDNIFKGKITLKVRTKVILNDLMNRLKKINGIEKVTRE
jgi:GTP pyrophosphokinase